MSQPQKPFACTIADCGMTFTNEDHLHVHTKKHDMVLTLGMEQKAAFVADQTPTPTRFIRNCEEVGLFQDLQNVNPFDEGFKRAMETKAGVLSLDGSLLTPAATDDVLHTPQMFYPTTEAENSLYNQRNIIISRSSSDESGAIKEYETTTISKLTNEVTTISRVIETTDQIYHNADLNKETNLKFTNNIVTIQSNLIKKDFDKFKSSSVTSKVDSLKNNQNFTEISCKDVLLPNRCEVPPILSQKSLDYVVDSLTNDTFILESRLEPTGIGDKHVNDSFDNECIARNTRSNTTQLENLLKNKIKSIKKLKRPVNIRAKKSQEGKQIINVNLKATDEKKNDGLSGLEVIIKLPNQTYLKMRPVDELCSPDGSKLLTEYAKEKLRNNIEKKLGPANTNTASQNTSNQASNSNLPHILPNNIILPISSGTLIPVKIISPVTTAVLQANTIDDCSVEIENNIKTAEIISEEHTKVKKHNKTKGVKRKKAEVAMKYSLIDKESIPDSYININDRFIDKQSDKGSIDTDKVEIKSDIFKKTERQDLLERKSAASKRYRQNFKSKIESQKIENDKLKQINMKLKEENARLKSLIIEHATKCSNPANLPVFKVNPI